jgi:hypothetical protein
MWLPLANRSLVMCNMVSTLELLVRMMRPPEKPFAASGDWQAVAAAVGTGLPSDYKAFIARYGTGRVSGFVWVYNPFEENAHLNLLSCYRTILDADREIRESFPDDVPEPLFPERGGLLPWAVTDNGDRLYWRTNGEPDSWPVVVWESRGPRYESYALSMAGFLLAWLNGEITVPVFPPEDWQPVFEQNPSYGE